MLPGSFRQHRLLNGLTSRSRRRQRLQCLLQRRPRLTKLRTTAAGSPDLISGIYEIVNTGTADRYVGSSCHMRKRLWDHRNLLRKGVHENRRLQEAWNEAGGEGFQFKMVLLCQKKDLYFYEQLLFDLYKPVYNLAPRAGGGRQTQFSAEQLKEIRALRSESKWTMPKIAAKFGTTKQVVWNIIHRNYYNWPD